MLRLGPISVLPECQRQGIGGRLISRTRELARELGFRALLLCGDPDYYLYQGFVPAEMLGIRTADNMYAMALHVCELYDGALSGIRGAMSRIRFTTSIPSAAEAFDREFPAKGKVVGTESQRRFDEIVVVRRPAE